MFEEKKEQLAYKLSSRLEAERRRSYLVYIALGGMVVNVISWVVAFITPDALAEAIGLAAEFVDKVETYLLAVPFWSTFVAAYALCSIPKRTRPELEIPDDEFMSGYRDSERREKIRNLILISSAAGAINVIVLMLGVIWFRG